MTTAQSVYEAYQKYLGRTPESEDVVQFWAKDPTALEDIAASAEATKRASDAAAAATQRAADVGAAYQKLLGRSPESSSAVQFWAADPNYLQDIAASEEGKKYAAAHPPAPEAAPETKPETKPATKPATPPPPPPTSAPTSPPPPSSAPTSPPPPASTPSAPQPADSGTDDAGPKRFLRGYVDSGRAQTITGTKAY